MAENECCSILFLKSESYNESFFTTKYCLSGLAYIIAYIIAQMFTKTNQKNTSVP